MQIAPTITDDQIDQLAITAGEHGDLLQAAICQVALHGAISERTAEHLMPDDLARAKTFTSQTARAECARVLAEFATIRE